MKVRIWQFLAGFGTACLLSSFVLLVVKNNQRTSERAREAEFLKEYNSLMEGKAQVASSFAERARTAMRLYSLRGDPAATQRECAHAISSYVWLLKQFDKDTEFDFLKSASDAKIAELMRFSEAHPEIAAIIEKERVSQALKPPPTAGAPLR